MARAYSLDLPSADDLFTTQEQRDDNKREKVYDIPLNEIDSFPDHPFHVSNDEAMLNMVESIRQYGVQTPAIVRRKDNGRYELISGHRRKRACELVGLETMPVIIRNMSRDESIIFMVDSNLQRERILPSEKALSYKMKMEAMKRKAGRPSKDNCSPLANNYDGKKSAEIIGEQTGDSKDQVYRYIRLTELEPELLEMVDSGKIAFRPAVELSYLPKEKQASIVETIEADDCTPSLAQAIKMKKFEHDGKLSNDVILSIMSEEKPNQVELFKMPQDKINKFFPATATKAQIEDTIIKALELYRKRERSRDMER
jgi:ParB family chromosome partitioning protein